MPTSNRQKLHISPRLNRVGAVPLIINLRAVDVEECELLQGFPPSNPEAPLSLLAECPSERGAQVRGSTVRVGVTRTTAVEHCSANLSNRVSSKMWSSLLEPKRRISGLELRSTSTQRPGLPKL